MREGAFYLFFFSKENLKEGGFLFFWSHFNLKKCKYTFKLEKSVYNFSEIYLMSNGFYFFF